MKTNPLIPFDLSRAKAGNPIITRYGRAAKFIAHVPECDEHLLVLIEKQSFVDSFGDDGRFYIDTLDQRDLFMAPKLRKGWVVFDKETLEIRCSHVLTEDNACNANTIKVAIEWEES